MELVPGCWGRVQRYLLSQQSFQRQLAAAQYFLSDGAVAPQNVHNILRCSTVQSQLAAEHDWRSSSINDSSRMWNEEAGSKWGRLLGALSQTPSIAAVSSRYSSTASLVGNAVHGVQPLAPESGGGLPREERAPLKQSHACNGRRSIHASSVVADTENQDGQSGISKVVSDMIEYCNTCRSKGG